MKNLYALITIIFLLQPLNGQDSDAGSIALINGIEMYYEMHGIGEPLILLHGFFSTGDWWNFAIEDLSKQFKIIIPDLRGHGRSTNPLEHWTMAQSARDIFALLDHLGIERASGIGISTGAKTLLHMATQERERVASMVLIGGAMYYPESTREVLRSGSYTIDKVTNEEWESLRSLHIHGDEQIQKLYRQFTECAEDYEDMTFIPPYLKTIKAKTLIIHGDSDWAYPVDMATEMYKSIPNSYLWVVPNGGHWPFDVDNSEVFIRTTLEFLMEWN